MSEYTKKPDAGHTSPSLTPMKEKDHEGLTLTEAGKARSDSAATDKNKRESGKDKEQSKR